MPWVLLCADRCMRPRRRCQQCMGAAMVSHAPRNVALSWRRLCCADAVALLWPWGVVLPLPSQVAEEVWQQAGGLTADGGNDRPEDEQAVELAAAMFPTVSAETLPEFKSEMSSLASGSSLNGVLA